MRCFDWKQSVHSRFALRGAMPLPWIFVLVLFFASSVCTTSVVDFTDLQWTLEDLGQGIKVKGSVPGGVYSDLRNAGVLKEEIFKGFNDQNYRWVAQRNWTYQAVFTLKTVPDDLSLVFHGIDTTADIILNNVTLGRSQNMFVRYRFAVGGIVRIGTNVLTVKFLSPIEQAKLLATQKSHKIPSECWPDSYHGECHINQLRKMQASFAWDWGPAFPSVGIWKNIQLQPCSKVALSGVSTNAVENKDYWNLTVNVWFEPCNNKIENTDGILTMRLKLHNSTLIKQKRLELNLVSDFQVDSFTLNVPKELVQLWWPNGYGDQVLYDLEVSADHDGITEVKFNTIAFRTVELIQEPVSSDPSKGLSFYFKVNNESIFAKGSNWIPSDILPERSVNKKRINHLLKSASMAHFNMLRVWGGGIYESEHFYKKCDQMGIMIWHDLMFACNMYPATDDYLLNVKKEVSQQIVRLQHHPSIVLWAGNNENEAALRQNWYNTKKMFGIFKEEYIKLYVDTIKPIVSSLDPSRPYLESSPSNGLESEKEGYIATDPQSPLFGDVHYYNYLTDMWLPNTFPRARFASEYGVQSLPSMLTLGEVASSDDLTLGSKWINARQHQSNGFAFMKLQLSFNLPTPVSLANLVYLSQINQAVSIQVETETYRRQRSEIYSTGEGGTMGALYWQLNDVWQAPSWSSIDYSGRWKMIHYYAQKFFSPLILSPFLTPDDQVVVYIVNDTPTPLIPSTLEINVISTKGFVPLIVAEKQISVGSNQAVEVLKMPLSSLTENCVPTNECFIKFKLLNDFGEKVTYDAFVFPKKLKYMLLPSPNISISNCTRKSSKSITFEVESSSIALFVWLEIEGVEGVFSDNGFHMTESTKEIIFKSNKPITMDLEKLRQRMSVTHFKTEFKSE